MDVGLAVVFQGTNKELSDHQVYQQDLRLGLLAEELGFQSIWGIEHHFTDYTMCPDPVQFLSYFAPPKATSCCSAPWSSCCPGMIRCASPKKFRCSTICQTAA